LENQKTLIESARRTKNQRNPRFRKVGARCVADLLRLAALGIAHDRSFKNGFIFSAHHPLLDWVEHHSFRFGRLDIPLPVPATGLQLDIGRTSPARLVGA
jgi:hypothetical protein